VSLIGKTRCYSFYICDLPLFIEAQIIVSYFETMQFSLITLLGLAASTSALYLPNLDQPTSGWNFSIFQTDTCSPSLGGASKHSGNSSESLCNTGLEWLFASALVYSDADSACNVTFYQGDSTNGGGTCSLPVASTTDSVEVGTCFKFDPNNRPVTYDVFCQS
jgi:hypothetical protein